MYPAPGGPDGTGRHDRAPEHDRPQRPPPRGEPAAPPPGGGNAPLTRRVRGAQMPTANPMSVPRTTGQHPVVPGAGPEAPPGRPAEPPRQARSADDVYSFLTSFTAGVQRGLDDSQPPGGSGDDNGSG